MGNLWGSFRGPCGEPILESTRLSQHPIVFSREAVGVRIAEEAAVLSALDPSGLNEFFCGSVEGFLGFKVGLVGECTEKKLNLAVVPAVVRSLEVGVDDLCPRAKLPRFVAFKKHLPFKPHKGQMVITSALFHPGSM